MKTEDKNYNLKLCFGITAILTIISQIISIYSFVSLKDKSFILIDNFLNFTYSENTGGPFGIGQDNTIGFILISIIIIAIIIHFIVAQRERIDKIASIALSFMLAGGFSNLIDRILRGAVIDYMDITTVLNFPIFNLSDILVITGWILLIISIIAYIKGEKSDKKINFKNKQ